MPPMESFPAFFPLEGARIVVVGDGEAADAKARLFSGSPARLVRIGAEAALRPESYAAARLVFVTLADPAAAEQAAAVARAAGALVNVVDQPRLCDFVTPSIVDRGPVVAAIGTGGAAPVLATLLRGEIEARWPEGLGRLAVLSRLVQAEVRGALPDLPARRAFWRRLVAGPAAQAALDGDMAKAERLARAAILGDVRAAGRVWVLRAPQEPSHLTLAAVRALGSADRIIVGEPVAPGVLAYARRDAPLEEHADRVAIDGWLAGGEALLLINVEQADLKGLPAERLP